MSMYLKLMGPENAPDDDSRKGARIISGVEEVQFSRGAQGNAVAEVLLSDGARKLIPLEGNAYVMNSDGKTIDSCAFGCAPIPGVQPRRHTGPKGLA